MATDPYLDDEQESSGGFNPMELLRLFLRRKWLFMIPFVICLGMAYVAIKTMKPIYFASGQLRVTQERSAARTLDDSQPRYTRSRDADRETMTLIRNIVTSPKFLESIVRDLELQFILPPGYDGPAVTPGSRSEERVVLSLTRKLENWIKVENDEEHIFTVGVRHGDPDQAYRIIVKVLDRFLEEEQASRLESTENTRDFLNEQRGIYEANLRDAQRDLTNFQRSMLSSTLAGNPVNEQNLSLAETLLEERRNQVDEFRNDELGPQLTAARQVVPAIQSLSDDLRSEPEISTLVRELSSLLTALLNDELAGRSNQTENQNSLGSKRLSMDTVLRGRIRDEYPGLDPTARQTVSLYLNTLYFTEAIETTVEGLNRQIRDCRNFITRQPEQAAELRQLQREVDRAQELLQNIEQDITRQNLSLAASMSNIGYNILMHRDPSYPEWPIEPDKKKLAMMGFALALALGVGMVLLAQVFDRSFRNIRQIESTLGVKVIGTLPVISDGPFDKYRRRRVVRWLLVTVFILGLAAGGLLWLYPRLSG